MLRQQQPVPSMAKRHVAVVGAGFAGLAAARTLLAEGKGAVGVTLLEADVVVGGRGRRGQLASGPVEMGATWFHGTEGNPVFDYATNLLSGTSSTRGSGAPSDVQPQQDKPKDSTANAHGSDARWQLQLVAPGEATSLSGARHQAILSAFEQYSLAVEDIAEDAEAAAAAAAASTHTSQAQQAAADTAAAADSAGGAGSGPAAVQGCSLGQILRARFDSIVNSSGGPAPQQDDQKQQQQQQQQQHSSQPASPPGEVAAWLAADATGVLKQAFAEGWGCRERLQRAYDGFHSADVAGLAHMTEYVDLDGPNIPVPGGYQSIAEALAAEAQALGLELQLNCPVDRIIWARSDGKVSLLLRNTPAAAGAAAVGSSSNSSSAGAADASAGSVLVFDAVVVTCSLGVLKTSAQQLFQPGLPASKAAAIEQLHIGQVEKMFVEWPSEEAAASGQQQADQQQQQQLLLAAAVAPAAQPTGHTDKSEQQQQQLEPSSAPRQQLRPSSAPRQPATTPTVGPRKPKQLHDMGPPGQAAAAVAAGATANAAGAAATPDSAAVAPGSSSSSTGGSTDAYTTYCLLWHTQPEVWGQGWLQQQQAQVEQQALPTDLPAHDPVYAGAAAAAQGGQHTLPEWLYGLHSWRYGDGPEWIKPANGAAGPMGLQPPSRSVVIWVTGRAAQQMGQLSDQQVLQDLEVLLQTYPALPRPDGGEVSLQDCRLLRSSWTTSPFFRGSYSYPSTQADGSTADALAAPLTAADAAAAAAAAAAAGAGASGRGDAAQGSGGGSGAAAGPGDSQDVLVCFAGEATSRIHMGTVHGAFNSGVREAHRLLLGWGMLGRDGAAGGQHAAGAQGPAEYHAAFWL